MEATMSNRIWPRLGAASGIFYVSLLFGPSLVGGEVAGRIELVGILFLVPFLAYLSSVLRQAEGEGGWLSATVFGAGLVDLAIKLGSAAPSVAAEQVKEGSPLDTVLHDINDASFILSMLPLSVLAAAFAIVTLKTGVLPRWLGWMGAITSLALFANGMALEAEFGPGFLVFLLWTIATSAVLVRRAGAGVRPITEARPAPAH
jgi:Domain of unknown function (DUF4386)